MNTTHTIIGTVEAYRPTQIKAEALYYFNKKVQRCQALFSVSALQNQRSSVSDTPGLQ